MTRLRMTILIGWCRWTIHKTSVPFGRSSPNANFDCTCQVDIQEILGMELFFEKAKERNVNDTPQRQRRCATEPRVAPSGATLGCRFQINTNPEWPNGVAPSFTVQLGGTPSAFRVHGGMGLLTQGRRSLLAPTPASRRNAVGVRCSH